MFAKPPLILNGPWSYAVKANRYFRGVLILLVWLGILNASCYAQIVLRDLPFPQKSELPGLEHTIQNTTSPTQKAEALNQLAAYYIQTPYPRIANIETAFSLANQSSVISVKNKLQKQHNDAQLLIGYSYIRRNLPDSAVKVLPLLTGRVRFQFLLSISYYIRTQLQGNKDSILPRAMKFAVEAQTIARKFNDTTMSLRAMHEIAGIHSEYNEKKLNSEKELLDIVGLLRSVGSADLQYLYFELFGTALLEGNQDKAMQYSVLALKSQAESKDSALLADLNFAHGMILRQKGDHVNSIEYLTTAIDLYKRQYGSGSMNYALQLAVDELAKLNRAEEGHRLITKLFNEYPPDNLTDSLDQLKSIATFYRVTKQYEKAEMYQLMNIKLREKNGKYPLPYKDLGQIYVEAKRYDKAKPYLMKALQGIDSRTPLRVKGHLYYCLFVTDSALGNYLSAIRYLNENKRVDDSLMTQAKVDALEKYKTQFETEKKEDSLKFKDQHISLLTQTTNLQEENLRQSYLVRNITIAGIILAGIVITLLYLRYRTKQKSNTLISKKNDQLQKLVDEKEWLLKEVHHRVKNNLQTVVSLLELQSEYLDSDALSAIQASQNRIYATSLLHQKLYRSENLSSVNMNSYLLELIQYLKDAYNIQQEIRFVTNITPVELDVTQAVPLGLIVNEAITNSFKYAFRQKKEGAEIMISLTVGDDMADLLIADNGSGFSANKELEEKGIGMKLIKGLAEDIDGGATIDSTNGTHILIRFKPRLPLETIINQQGAFIA